MPALEAPRQVPSVTAVALPADLPTPAAMSDANFPDPPAPAGFVNRADSDFGQGDAAVWAAGDRSSASWTGSADDQSWLATGKDFMASVAAAAKYSTTLNDGQNDEQPPHMAVGVYQATDGTNYLTDLPWSSDGNDAGVSLSLNPGDHVRRGSAQLQALVSDGAWADLRTAKVAAPAAQ